MNWWTLILGAFYFFVMGFTANIFVSEEGLVGNPSILKRVLLTIFWPWPWGELVVELIKESRRTL